MSSRAQSASAGHNGKGKKRGKPNKSQGTQGKLVFPGGPDAAAQKKLDDMENAMTLIQADYVEGEGNGGPILQDCVNLVLKLSDFDTRNTKIGERVGRLSLE